MSMLATLLATAAVFAADQPQWGERFTRNMISPETNAPVAFDIKARDRVLWSVDLGGGSYSSAIVAGGKVFVGTNNSLPLDPRHKGDRAVMLCLNEKDGSLCWQLVVPRIGGDDYLDWPDIGLCSEPTVEGDRLYTVTNRGEVVCLDAQGLANGNDGPFTDEGRHMTPADEPAMTPGPLDADILWLFDMRAAVAMYPHDSPHVSILLDGDVLYLNTCNGVDNTHAKVRSPDAPSLLALDKKTGRLLAHDGEFMARRLFHSTWSPPALADIDGRRLVIFGGPDGVCYAFNALAQVSDAVRTLECVWRFDCDPAGPKEDVARYLKNAKESPSVIMGMPVVHKDRVYVTAGGDMWWGKHFSWVKCIDAAKTGDVTQTAGRWSFAMRSQCCSTPAIVNGLVFIPESAGKLHCLDAETGEAYWSHQPGGKIWGSPLAADNKIYIGTRDGTFAVLAADKTLNVLFTTQFEDEINATATLANGVLYIPTLTKLYAVK